MPGVPVYGSVSILNADGSCTGTWQCIGECTSHQETYCQTRRSTEKPVGAVAFVTVISAICCFINWGFGLIIGALLAKEVAKKIKGLDYRLIIAAAYSGFVIWHAGISGSIPLGMTAIKRRWCCR